MFRVGIIGLGYIGAKHSQAFSAIPDVAVAAIADLNPDVLAKQPGAQTFSDYRDLLALQDLDLIVICLPNNQHAKVTIESLTAGHHVLCEKPMATTLADAEAMHAAAEEQQRILSVVMNFRWEFFGPDAFHLRQLIADGELGDIYFVRAQYLRRTTFPDKSAWRWNLSQEESGGGTLIDLGPHMLDLAMWLLGDYYPQSVCGFTHNGLMSHSPVDDFASGTVVMASGVRLQVELAWNSHNKPARQICIYGDKGGAIIDAAKPAGQRITRFTAESGEMAEKAVDSSSIQMPAEASLQQHVVARMRAGEPPDCSADHAIQVMKVIDAWYRSGDSQDLIAL